MKHQQEKSKQTSKIPGRSSEPVSSGPGASPVLELQRVLGNQQVLGLLRSSALQAKHRVSRPDDIYEQEADRVADEVMRTPDRSIQTKPG